MLQRVHSVLSVCSYHVAFVNTLQKLRFGRRHFLPIQPRLHSKLFEYGVHMISVEILNIIVKRVNPFDELVSFVISIKYLMDFGFIKVDALLDDVHLVEGFEVNRFNLLDK